MPSLFMFHMGIQAVGEFIHSVNLDSGAQKVIPNGEYIAVIPIGVGEGKMMVDFMKMRGYKNGRKYFFYPWAGLNIGMGQMGKKSGSRLIQHHNSEGCPGNKDGQCGEQESHNAFTGMVSQS